MNRCNRPRRRKWRPSSTAPAWLSRPEAEIQRPVAPGVEVAKPKRLLWIAAAVVLGIVLAVAGAAILMRQKPQDLAIKPPVETQQPAPPEPSAKIAERVQTNPPAPARAARLRERAASDPTEPLRARRQRPRRPKRRRSRPAPPRLRRRPAGRRC